VTWQFAGGDHQTTLRLVPVTVPKATFLTSMKPLPVTVTLVPPPEVGLPSVTPTTAQMLRPSPVM